MKERAAAKTISVEAFLEKDSISQVAQPVQPASNGPSSTTGGKKPTSKAAAPKQKKQTVASLARALEGLTVAIPALTAQLTDLTLRTQQIWRRQCKGGSRASALRQPTGSLGIGGSSKASPPFSSLLQAFCPGLKVKDSRWSHWPADPSGAVGGSERACRQLKRPPWHLLLPSSLLVERQESSLNL